MIFNAVIWLGYIVCSILWIKGIGLVDSSIAVITMNKFQFQLFLETPHVSYSSCAVEAYYFRAVLDFRFTFEHISVYTWGYTSYYNFSCPYSLLHQA